MKILLIHNYYRSSSPSGENLVFQAESKLLQNRGHQVEKLIRRSDDLHKKGPLAAMCGAACTPINPRAASTVGHKVKISHSDVVHAHNTFPLFSPSIFRAAGKTAATVLTLHNYRVFCPKALPLRNGRTCTACIDTKSVWRSVAYGCYRESRIATIPLALCVALHRAIGTWHRHVDAFIALSKFQKKIMVKAGLPEGRVHVKPNFYAGNPAAVPWEKRNNCVVFAGRLSAEKGVENLISAWLRWGDSAPELRILGDGPLRGQLQKISSRAGGNNVRFFGQVSGKEAEDQIARAKLLILPSVCFEGFPMVLREAFAFGTPAAVSDIGPLPSIVEHGKSGVVFAPGNVDSLLKEVRTACEAPGYMEKLALGAKNAFGANYTEEANYQMLMKIYQAAIANFKSRV